MSPINNVKDEPNATLPANDVERWIAGTYAIWSEYCGGSCRYLGGYEKTAENAKMVAKVLYNDWLVKDHKSGVETIEYLLEHAGPDNDDGDFDDDEDFDDEEYDEDDEEYDEDDGDFDDDEEYDEDDGDFDDDEEYDEDDGDFGDDEEYDEDDGDFGDDEEYDEDDGDFDDEEYDEDDGDFGDDEEYDEDDEDFGDDEEDAIAQMGALIDTTAFDYACACNMCGRMYIAGYLTREESLFYAKKAAKKIQEKYNSWVEYYQAYILGAAVGSNAKQAAPFIEAFQKIMMMPDNPIYMDWNIEL